MAGRHIIEPKYVRELEDVKIMTHAQSYPEEMRESFVWFARYLRDTCRKNLDVLVTKLSKLGFTTTAGTFAKMLQGRWNKDTEGRATPPIIALNNFLQQVERLREMDRVSRLNGKIPFIETETFLDLKAYIDIRRAADTVCKFGLIIGPTGSQKTASFKRLVEMIGAELITHLEAPYTPTMTKFITDLAEKFGVSRSSTHHLKVQRIRDNVNEARCIIIDNVQRLYKEGRGWNQPIFNFIQKLQDDTGCTIILCAVPEFEMKLMKGKENGYFEQFEGRCGGRDEFHIMPDFTPREDLIQIAEAFSLKATKETITLLEELSQRRGRVRIVFNSIQKAQRLADSRQEKLSVVHLREVITKVKPETELKEAA